MAITPQQTAEAYWLLYQSLPEEVRQVIKFRIVQSKPDNASTTDFSKLATKGWDVQERNYSRDELYD